MSTVHTESNVSARENTVNWLLSLKVGDKLDVYSKIIGQRCQAVDELYWLSGTIAQIDDDTEYRILIHFYDDRPGWNRWITVHHSMDYESFKPIYAMTGYHYKANCKAEWRDQSGYGRWLRPKKWNRCRKCDRRACDSCADRKYGRYGIYESGVLIQECVECFFSTKHNRLYNICRLFYLSIFHDMNMEMNVIKIITNYSFVPLEGEQAALKCESPLISCSNVCNPVVNVEEISFDFNEENICIGKEQIFVCYECRTERCRITHSWMSICDECGADICKACDYESRKRECEISKKCKKYCCNECRETKWRNQCALCPAAACNECDDDYDHRHAFKQCHLCTRMMCGGCDVFYPCDQCKVEILICVECKKSRFGDKILCNKCD